MSRPAGSPRSVFDADYYRRFYRDRPVHDRRSIGHLASGVLGLCGWWGIRVRSVLDIGAGPALWRDWLARERPRVRYHSIDVSDFACRRYGHVQADIAQWRPDQPADLVVCQGVLQYLDGAACSRAIVNVAAATGGVLYLEVPTLSDRVHVIDPESTDLDIYWRSGSWYRRRLRPHFVALGCGLFAARTADLNFYELEAGYATAASDASEKTR